MEMQVRGPSAGWSWLVRGLNAGFHHPKVLFGAGLLFMLYVVLVAGLQILVQRVWVPSPVETLVLTGLMMLVGAVVYPLLCGGFMRVMDAVENGRPARASGVFDLFRRGQGGRSIVILGISLMLIYLVVVLLLFFTVGRHVGGWYMQLMASNLPGATHAVFPPLPSGFGATLALLMVFFIFYSGAFAIAMGQVALRAQPPRTALRDGMAGALKNGLPLVVLAVVGTLGAIVFAVGVAIVVLMITLLASLLSKALALVLTVAIYLAMMLLMYVVVFGVMYAVWQDVAGGGQHDADEMPATSVEA